MDVKMKKWIKRIVLIAIDLALVGAIAYSRFLNPPGEITMTLFQALADGFFVVGFFNMAFGALVMISATGFFDIFGFAFKSFINFFIPRSMIEQKGTYYEYKVKKAEKRKETVTFRGMMVIGIVMMVIGILFNVLVYA